MLFILPLKAIEYKTNRYNKCSMKKSDPKYLNRSLTLFDVERITPLQQLRS